MPEESGEVVKEALVGRAVEAHVSEDGGASESLAEQLFFIDANVLLSLAEPDKKEMQESSLSFLQRHEGHLVISDLVMREVFHQLRKHAYKYRGAKAVRRWAAVCGDVTIKNRQELVERLGLEYAERGWYGEAGDIDDRLHAAAASAFSVPFLVTWDRRFREQEDWIAEVNQRHGLKVLRLIRPDSY